MPPKCTYYKYNGLSQTIRQLPEQKQEDDQPPLECTFERKNLGQVKSVGSENSRRDVSPEYLTLTERKQQ